MASCKLSHIDAGKMAERALQSRARRAEGRKVAGEALVDPAQSAPAARLSSGHEPPLLSIEDRLAALRRLRQAVQRTRTLTEQLCPWPGRRRPD